MTGASGRFTITFNGEIYNYKDLQKELSNRGVRLRGGSDTEVLLECFEIWGSKLHSLNAMECLR